MPVAMLIDNPDGSQELYEALRTELGLDRPAGGIVHVAGPGPSGGWRVFEVWDSVAEASEFLKERFGPALQKLGFTGRAPEPQFWPVHALMATAREGRPQAVGDRP